MDTLRHWLTLLADAILGRDRVIDALIAQNRMRYVYAETDWEKLERMGQVRREQVEAAERRLGDMPCR
jgi:hypothetical protein